MPKKTNRIICDISKLATLASINLEQTTNVMNMTHVFTEILKYKDGFFCQIIVTM